MGDLRSEASFDQRDFGPMLTVTSEGGDTTASASGFGAAADGGGKPKEKLEQENAQLLRELLTCKKNLDISQQNVSTLKALSNQLVGQLNTANTEIEILRERRDAADLRNVRDSEAKISEIRAGYERELEKLRKELEDQLEINLNLSKESQDSHRKADKSFREIIASKDELIAELTRTVECLQAGIKSGGTSSRQQQQQGRHQSHHRHSGDSVAAATAATSPDPRGLNASVSRTPPHQQQQQMNSFSASSSPNLATTLSSPDRYQKQQQEHHHHHHQATNFDAVSLRNKIIEPTLDLLRLSLRVMKTDLEMRKTPLGDVSAKFYTSEKNPVTRYFVDVQADKHRLDEVPTVSLVAASPHTHQPSSHYKVPQWPRVWKFNTPQGELISLTLDIASL